jgi:hypothetical protein
MNKNKFLRLLPYLTSIITGGVVYCLSYSTNLFFSDLLVSISASLIAIPILYLVYEKVKKSSHQKLTKEIFDYAKMNVDSEILSILNQLQKIVYLIDDINFSTENVNIFLKLKTCDIESQLKNNKYLGFQIFKHWEISETGLHELLRNTFILDKMEDEQVISVIQILKCLRNLEELQRKYKLYLDTGEIAIGFKLQSGVEMNPLNIGFKERYLLLKHLNNDKYIVKDFGDIPKYNLDKCLKYYRVDKKLTGFYAEIISSLMTEINGWLATTGQEFVIDTKKFRNWH